MRNVFTQEGRGFPAFGAFNTSPAISSSGRVYPEISAGCVGVSYSSLEFVQADKSRVIPPLPKKYIQKHIQTS